MATAEQGGPTSTTTANNSSYGGGTGAGGKFRKKPPRRQPTPYDRPLTVHRPTADESRPSWLTKLVVDPASKLISYGANRFFGSLLRKRLPPPETTQPPPEVNVDSGVQFEDAVQSQPEPPKELAVSKPSQLETTVRESSQLINNSNSNGISDLAQLLKQKTFTRSEITHLTELLQSKAGEISCVDESEKEKSSMFDRRENVAGDSPDVHGNEGIRSHALTPVFSSKVLEDDIGSPAELAKAYMGSRPSKVSPSMLGMHSQVGRDHSGVLSNIPFTSKSSIVPLTRRNSDSHGAVENGFSTPRSRGRSAIYNMARTPYSRGHQTSIVRGGGNSSNDFSLPIPSQRLAISEHGEKLDSRSTVTLKRRSSFIDDEAGSVGPIRRIRQKHNLLVPRIPHTAHGTGIGSAKKQHPLIGEGSHELSKAIVGKENGSLASTSHVSVPTQSTQVASRILQHLEKLSPKEKSSDSKLAPHKSSESKFIAAKDSPFKLTSGMLRGQALRSMEDVGTSKFMLDIQDDHRIEDRSNSNLPDAPELTSRNQEKVEATVHKASPVSMKSYVPSIKISDSPASNGATQPPQKKRAFRMSAQEDSFEQEDDVHNDGTALVAAFDTKAPTEVLPTESNPSAAKNLKSLETSSFVLGKSSGSGLANTGEGGSAGRKFFTSEEASTASQAVFSPPPTSFDKQKVNPPLLFSFSSKVVDKVPAVPSESTGNMQEPEKLDSSSSFSIAAPNGSPLKTPESDNGNAEKPTEKNVGPDHILSASNGLFGSKPPGFSFTAASASDTNQVSAGITVLSTSSTSIADSGTGSSTLTPSTGSIFGSAVAPAPLAEPVFKFSPVDPSYSVTSATIANTAVADSKTNAEKDKSFGSSEFTVPAFSAAGSGSSTFGLASPAVNNLQGSLFGGTIKSFTPGVETAPQGSSVQSSSSTSLPSFSTNSSTPFGSLSNSNSKPTSQLGSSPALFNSIADPVSRPAPGLVKFGPSSTAFADSNSISSNSNTSTGVFTFGLSSSSTSTSTIDPAATPSPFVFGTSPVPAPAPAVNTSSSFGSGTSPFNFGGNSSSSSAAVSSTTSSVTNVFGSLSSSQAPGFPSAFPSTPSTGFNFAASSTPAASAAPTGSSTPIFSFTGSTPTSGFGASPGNDQMNAEDSMAEDPVQSSASLFGQPAVSQSAASIFGQPAVSQTASSLFGQPAVSQSSAPIFGQLASQSVVSQPPAPIFGQPAASPTPSGFMFGQTAPGQANPFQFGGQPSQPGQVNPNPFQSSGSLEFNAGGSFSLGSGGDKANRRRVNVSKIRNRKK